MTPADRRVSVRLKVHLLSLAQAGAHQESSFWVKHQQENPPRTTYEIEEFRFKYIFGGCVPKTRLTTYPLSSYSAAFHHHVPLQFPFGTFLWPFGELPAPPGPHDLVAHLLLDL